MKELSLLSSKEWRLSNLYDIVDKRQEQVRFKRNPIQEAISRVTNKRKMILKARQFGVSTNEIIDIFDDTIWKRNQTNVILAHEDDSIKKLFRIVKRAYDFYPDKYKPVLDRGGGSKYELYFPEINSRIYCDLEVRSDTVSRLLVSEAAFFRDPIKLVATLQAVPIWCPVTLESTPNGMESFFYEWWQDTTSPYAKLFYPWYLFPEYTLDPGVTDPTSEEKEFCKKAKKLFNIKITAGQLAFRRLKKSELRELYIQEYPEDDQTCFLSSGNSPWTDMRVLKSLLDSAPRPIDENEYLKIYQEKKKGMHYVLGGDTSEGAGGDYSVGVVMEVETRKQVAILRVNKKKPSDFAHLCVELAMRYAHGPIIPMIGIERNNHGHAVLLELHEHIRYGNLFTTHDEKLGWLTDKVTRPIMLDVLIQGVENSTCVLVDPVTIRECLTLVNNEGKIEAATGKNDDCVLAAAIALQLCVRSTASTLYNDFSSKIRI